VLLGLAATIAVAATTVWLAVSGHLDLYINPRYDVFTVVLAGVAVIASVVALVAVVRGGDHGHDHDDHDHDHDVAAGAVPRRRIGVLTGVVGAVAVVVVAVAMLVLPPTTLSARTAEQRSVDAGSLTAAAGSDPVRLIGGGDVDTTGYGVKDWAALIRQTTDTSSLVGQRLTLTGFVTNAGSARFTLTRFVISCCAVDAQPVGIGVATTDDVPSSGSWVKVTGALVANPDASASDRLVIRPSAVTPVHEPSDPYEY
jgi:uncharacterized repeat protein (TIGR03943 family)